MKKLFAIIILLLALTPVSPVYALDCACYHGVGTCTGAGAEVRDCNECADRCGGRLCIAAPEYCRAGPGGASPAPAPSPAPAARAPASSPGGRLTGPALNPICWLQEDCERSICNGKDATTAAGGCFEKHPGDAECTGVWGRCYPPDQPVPLQISIGGVAKVQNLGQYVKIVYQIAVSAATIVATIMLIWGGIQWMVGGAAPEKLSQAKKTIGNAVLGLVLVLASYVILNTINPDLTRLSLPRLAALRQITIGSNFCSNLPPSTKLTSAGRRNRGYRDINIIRSGDYTIDPAQAKCNWEYYIQNAGDSKCFGQNCTEAGPGYGCVFHSNRDSYGCEKMAVGGEIAYSNKRYGKIVDLVAVCQTGNSSEPYYLQTDFLNEGTFSPPITNADGAFRQSYKAFFAGQVQSGPFQGGVKVAMEAYIAEPCLYFRTEGERGAGGLKGYLLLFELNDDSTGGLDDEILVGKKACNGGNAPFVSANLPVDYFSRSGDSSGDDDDQGFKDLPNDPGEYFTGDEVRAAFRGTQSITCNIQTSGFPKDGIGI